MNNKKLAEAISHKIYPTEWVTIDDFSIDNNAGRRAGAAQVAEYFIDVLRSEKAARYVLFAFFRREHRREPTKEEVNKLIAAMSTALMALDFVIDEDLEQ
jgi:hypothetical protein